MKRFIATLDPTLNVNIPADRMKLSSDEASLLVYDRESLVGVVNVAALLEAHMSEQGGSRNESGTA